MSKRCIVKSLCENKGYRKQNATIVDMLPKDKDYLLVRFDGNPRVYFKSRLWVEILDHFGRPTGRAA